MNLIRKISVGRDYKDNAMHYSIGQQVYGGHIISDILEEAEVKVFDRVLPLSEIKTEFNLRCEDFGLTKLT